MTTLAGGRRHEPDDHLGDRRFAGAGFADQREGLAPGDREGHVGDRRQQLARQALGQAIEPRLRDVEDATEVLDLDQRRGGHRRRRSRSCGRRVRNGCRASRRPASAASRCELRPYRSRTGANARGQRGWKAQPVGIASSRGIEPGIWTSRSLFAVERRDRAHQALGVGMQRRLDRRRAPARSRRCARHTSRRRGRRSRRSRPCRG